MTMATGSEIIEYQADCRLYSLAWSRQRGRPFRLAIGSFIEEYSNTVEILEKQDNGELFRSAYLDHPYPPTKIAWAPSSHPTSENQGDILATTGDFLRIWEYKDGKVTNKCLLNNSQDSEFCAPLTSFDWNEVDTSLVATSSIDTTCTVWNIETQQAKTQLIAHDKEVFDLAFALQSADIFATVGNDASVRLFDLRTLEHSTILYEAPDSVPLLRLRWNLTDPNYMATIGMDSSSVIVLDIRVPSVPVVTLEHQRNGRTGINVNSLSWAPHSSAHIATAGDNCQALIWDISSMQKRMDEPFLAYNAMAPVANIEWSSNEPDWVAITFDDKVRMLKV
eukprot:Plantae.Rhodophyta-Hildenbrandia_rubra.ctg9713.p1 GENE.Plantae.Rhodophyta-Hildenbrandia_rubra.ctg9713~~Plantae.Rhodophyta-Hildenbrandia_rubra.ctg9713.p1  ORF type:complete len:336 (-),score=59.05 Plantae.Rhodophyta-Hildenbrandia_rubra.ctg9713:401-1408(-)